MKELDKARSTVTPISGKVAPSFPIQDSDDQAYLTKLLIQVTLPHRQPNGNPEIWERTNGRYALSIRPGFVRTGGSYQRLGYPAGSIPRLILLWMTREALRKQERRIYLGNSLPGFMEAIGLNPYNGSINSIRSDRKRLHEQMTNLFHSQIKFDYQDTNRQAWQDLSVTSKGEIWWDFYSDGNYLFDSWVDLGEHFYEALLQAPVPLKMSALQNLKNSSLSLDLYAWSAYSAYTASKRGEPFRISWARLHENLGSDYARACDFKKKAIKAFQKILKEYPSLRLEDTGEELLVHASLTPVRPRTLGAST